MEFDLLDKKIVSRILSEMDKSEERDRRTYSFDAYQIYSGNQENYVIRQLQQKRPKSWQGYIASDVSIAGMVTKKKSQAYMLPVIRESQNSQEIVAEIYDDAHANRSFQSFDETFNLQNHAMMWVNWLADKQRFQFMALKPYEFSMVRNKDNGDLEVVIMNFPNEDITANAGTGDGLSDLIAESQADSSANGEVYVMWTKEQVVKVYRQTVTEVVGGIEQTKVDITYIPIDGNPENVNPIGILPFVYLSNDLSFDLPTRNPLATQSVKFNYQWSEVMTAANIQGSGQFVLKYPESMQGKLDNVNIGLLTAVELPQKEDPSLPATDATYISPSPNLAAQKDIAMTYLKNVLKEHGLEGENMELGESSAMSGISKAISGSNVQKIIAKNQMLYETVEMQCFEIVKRWLEVAKIPGMSIPSDEELRVIYPKPKVMLSDKETLENIEKKLDMGLIEKWEALVALDPNLTEEMAKEKLNLIETERNNNVRSILGGRVQPVGSVESDQGQSQGNTGE